MSDFVFCAVLTALIGLGRRELKEKVIGSPEILAVVHERESVKE